MINVEHLKAGYLYGHLWLYILQVKDSVLAWLTHLSSFFPEIILFIAILIALFIIRKVLITLSYLKQEKVFLELTPPAFTEKTSYTTQQLFSVLHNVGSQRTWMERLLGKKILFSFEIVSTKEKGIKYIVQTTSEEASIVKRTIRSYLPFIKVEETHEYLPDKPKAKVIEFTLTKHFAFPLAKQNVLEEHDPVAYITGVMTKLSQDELVSFQVIISPTKTHESEILSHKILRNEDILHYLTRFRLPWYMQPIVLVLKLLIKIIQVITKEAAWAVTELAHGSSNQQVAAYQNALYQNQQIANRIKPARVLSSFEQEAIASVQEKVNQLLFETTIRAFVMVENIDDQKERIRGIRSSLAPFTVPKYQSLQAKYNFPAVIIDKLRLLTFKQRLLSLGSNKSSTLLSISEISDLYHFPYTNTTKTENIVKVYSKELPAPLSLKSGRKLSVIFGRNNYGGTVTDIGITKEERETHMYIIGRTGSGKTTMLFSMAKNDIENNAGMAFLDPHGDVSEDLLASIPEERINDFVYINPIDLKYPVGINLLELTPGLDEDESELEKEVVCEGVISLFRKVFSKEENANAHRIEYILRNTIHTAFTVEGATIFTLYDLLNNPPFQKEVIKNLKDENLKNFWKFEFGRAGEYQVVKMVGGVTAKVGRFLFSPTAKRILEQKKSTINFDEIMNQGKILICNFSQGGLGEDTARLLGTTVLTKIQQSALRRTKLPKHKRKPFYLYVDEFQNFATNSFIKMLSEGRKYGLSVTIAEQSTSQQEEKNLVHNILANVTTVVCFRSANPMDEQLMLTQFSPYIEKGDIGNLPRYRFYIKISALEPEEPFSGETIYIPVKKDNQKMNKFIQASRDNYAIVYKRQTEKQEKIFISTDKPASKKEDKKQETRKSKALPESRKSK